ncbi:MAG: hypothetical protein HY567_04730 [Candidatus Kerfeldbacteria bacterium]|nr:hypothetical protein [Candidatus Kerfeldbacteria bacterium]
MPERHGSLGDFIERKHRIERERPLLAAEPRLVTIDGVDGAGKTTFSHTLADRLGAKFGSDRISLVNVNNFIGGTQQERLGDLMRNETLSPRQIDGMFAATVNRSYGEEVVPALDSGKIVVVDRSEIDLLRFAIEHGNEADVERRLGYLRDGTLTHRRWAGNRILMRVPAEDAWGNLAERLYHSKYDPTSVEDVRRRIVAEQSAESQVLELPRTGEVTVLPFENHRIEDQESRRMWLREQADLLIEKFRFV